MSKWGKTVGKRALRDKKGRKMGVQIVNQDGESRRLLTPAGKSAKYSEELYKGCQLRNDRQVRKTQDGKMKVLTQTQKAWRGGYLQCRKDEAKAYKAKNSNGSNYRGNCGNNYKSNYKNNNKGNCGWNDNEWQ